MNKANMTKYEKLEYLNLCVASQGNEAGLSIAPLLRAMIEENEDVFDVQVEDTEVNDRLVINEQIAIDEFIDAVNADPLHNKARVSFPGVVLSFAQMEYEDDQVNAMVELTGGKYSLTLSKTPGNSQLIFIPN